MFRAQKQSGERVAETIDFRFLQFRATKVPNGWNKLIVNVISMETGKTISRTNKALVHKESCQWSEDISESVCFLQDDNSRELEDKLYKFVVSMGSARSGILGEATINLADYLNSKLSVQIALPLKRCNHGTILHVKIQWLTPRAGSRDSGQRETALEQAEHISVLDDVDDGSEGSDNFIVGNVGSSSSHNLSSALQHMHSETKQVYGSMSPRKLQRGGASSAATSRYSSDSIEVLSATSSVVNGNPKGFSLLRRQHSAGSQDGSATNRAGNDQDQYGLSPSSFTGNSTGTVGQLENHWQDRATQGSLGVFHGGIENTNRGTHTITLTRGNASSKEFLKAAEVTIQELHTEAMMWERNARKSVLEAESLKQLLAEQEKQYRELEMEFSVTEADRNCFKQEVEQLKSTLQTCMERERSVENARFEVENAKRTVQEFQEELELQKESNVNLSLQLKKTQESNIELAFALDELEETIEQQNVEIEKLSEAREKILEMDLLKQELEEMRSYSESGAKVSAIVVENDSLKQEVEQLKSALGAAMAQQSFANAVRSEDAMHPVKELLKAMEVEKEFHENLSLELQQAGAFNQDSSLENKLNFPKKRINELKSELQITQHEMVEYEYRLQANEARVIKTEDERADALQRVQALVSDSTKDAIEVRGLKVQITQLEEKLKSAENSYNAELAAMEKSFNDYQNQVMELLSQKSGLESKVNILMDKIHELESEFQTAQEEAVEREIELTATYEHRLEGNEARTKKAEYELAFALQKIQTFETDNTKNEMAETISKLQKQMKNVEDQAATIQGELCNAQKAMIDLKADNERMKVELLNECTRWQTAENLINSLQMLNVKLQTRIQETESKHLRACSQFSELAENISQLQKQPCRYSLVEKHSPENISQIENVKMELHAGINELQEERHVSKSCNQDWEFHFSVRTEEIQSLSSSNQDFDMKESKLQMEKVSLEDRLETSQKESKAAGECLEKLAKQLENLTANVESIMLAKQKFEEKAMELEHNKEVTESHWIETRDKNVHMSEQIRSLESQLRNVGEERDSYKLDLENTKDRCFGLQTEMQKLELELREENKKLLQGLHELQNKLSGAVEEVVAHKGEQQKLLLSLDNLTREHAAVQESKLELEQKSVNLLESQANLEECLKNLTADLDASVKQIKSLELSSLKREMTGKERIWAADTEAYHLSKREYEDKAVKADEALRQACSGKASVLESLQSELRSLTSQMSSLFDEKEKALSEASELHAENVKYENSLQQIQAKVRQSEAELLSVIQGCRNSVQELMLQLNLSHKKEEHLDLELGIAHRLIEDMKGTEIDLRQRIHDLEMKVIDVENDRQKLKEENIGLNDQVNQLVSLRAEIDFLRSTTEDLRAEKSTLEYSFHSTSAELGALKAENILLMKNLETVQKGIFDVDKIEQSKAVLEQRILCFQAELSAKEVSSAHEADQGNESLRIKKLNSQFQCKLQDLEQEKEEFKGKGQLLEEELQLKMDELLNTEQKYLRRSISNVQSPSPSHTDQVAELCKKMWVMEIERNTLAKDFEEKEKDLCTNIEYLENMNQQLLQAQLDSDMDQLKMELIRLQKQNSVLSQREHEFLSKLATQELFQNEVQRLQEVNKQLQTQLTRFKETVKRGDILDRVVALETELAEALEANGMYKSQLRSVLRDEQNVQAVALKNFGTIDEVVDDLVGYKRKASALEADLNDMRERYSNLSLRLAEVEAQREELVMTIKNAKNGKRRPG